MNAEDQLRKLKQIPPLTPEEKRKKVVTAVVLAISTLISVLFLIYAFMQKLEADAQREIAVQLKVEAEKQREMAEVNRKVAEYAQREAEVQRKKAEEALAECQKSKR